MRITKYVTVTATSFDELDQQVIQLILNGFQPYGSPYSIHEGSTMEGGVGTNTVAQAMIKEEPSNPPKAQNKRNVVVVLDPNTGEKLR
jgi:hypothetical protein